MPIELDELAGSEGGAKSQRLATYWLDQIHGINESADYKRWVKRGEAVIKRYRDERNRAEETGGRRYSSLWSNVEIMRPALYGRAPIAIAERRFKDKDPIGRGAAQILERALRNEIEVCGYDDSLQQAVGDYLLPGRGVVWVRYEPEIEEGVSLPVETQTDLKDVGPGVDADDDDDDEDIAVTPAGRQRKRLVDEDQDEGAPQGGAEETQDQEAIKKLQDTGDRIVRESTPCDYISWADFFTFPMRARTWAEVTAVGKRVYLSREQAKRRFGNKIGGTLPMRRDDRGRGISGGSVAENAQDKVIVYEIWCSADKMVYWVCEGYQWLCDRKDDPLNLEYFYPCPKPLFANSTNNTLVPVPDYYQYQDQAIQIDELTQRIAMLTKACKIAGVYNAAAKDIQRMFQESVENELIPVDDWAAFGERGGVEGNISLLPVKDIITVINELMICKQRQIEEMDRLTGITDIMRGTTDARETLGGQRLKSNSSGTRLSYRQNEVARFARDVVRIIADIMSQHFTTQSLIEVSGALYEEGLGPEDMPGMNELDQMQPSAPQQPQPGLPAPQPPMGAMPPQTPPQAPPQGQPMATGGNVVPFKPPGLPMAPSGAPGMPPGGPQPGMGAPNPGVPPEMQARLKALIRIKMSIDLIRNERLRGFRIDIEVDSTIFPDAAQEKADRTQFIREITQFLQVGMQMGNQMPESIPLMAKLLQFGVRGYHVGRDLETAIEEFTDQAIDMAKKKAVAAATQPNMAQEKVKAEVGKLTAQGKQAELQGQADMLRATNETKTAQAQAVSDQAQAQAEVERQQLENEGERANSQADLQIKQMDVQIKRMEQQIEALRMQVEVAQMQHEAAHPAPAAPVGKPAQTRATPASQTA